MSYKHSAVDSGVSTLPVPAGWEVATTPDSVPTIDVEGYIGGELVGGIELQFEPEEQRLIYLPLVTRSGR